MLMTGARLRKHLRCRFAVTEASLLPLLSTLVTDVEFVVRQHLAEQFSGLSQVWRAV